jgi:hypothetical protein
MWLGEDGMPRHYCSAAAGTMPWLGCMCRCCMFQLLQLDTITLAAARAS